MLWLSALRGFVALFHVPSVSAQDSLIPANGIVGACNFLTGRFGFDCVPLYIGYLIKMVVLFAMGSFLIGIILAGYKYTIGSVTSEGKEQGKKELIAAIVGFSVVVLSYLLVDTILEALS